ncbi:hypothetical protein KSB_67040 [Ktedonobacter robiniae]|uniref:Uncharacterized protein n=1 Tax=Ktedonobacter robiniae TaxID=2778365 RepID=A0ABQ3UZE9_9CHLR|nr:hypothetical protein KSB_67040 [Ktedonobacter robiniae]
MCPGFNKHWETFGKDFALALSIVAEKLVDRKQDRDSLPSAGNILEPPLVVAM